MSHCACKIQLSFSLEPSFKWSEILHNGREKTCFPFPKEKYWYSLHFLNKRDFLRNTPSSTNYSSVRQGQGYVHKGRAQGSHRQKGRSYPKDHVGILCCLTDTHSVAVVPSVARGKAAFSLSIQRPNERSASRAQEALV